MYVTLFRGMSLSEYITARSPYCMCHHPNPVCGKCKTMLNVAQTVLENGYVRLSVDFKSAFPSQKYETDIALQRFLQMPLACVKVQKLQLWFLVEFKEGVDYLKLVSFVEALCCTKTMSAQITKVEIKSILQLACSDRERELIRFSAFKASGMSYTAARKAFGFTGMKEREK